MALLEVVLGDEEGDVGGVEDVVVGVVDDTFYSDNLWASIPWYLK